jgi:hypothetical protein
MAEWETWDRDYAALSHEQRLELLAAMQRDQARLDAARTRLLAALDPDPLAVTDTRGELDKHWIREDVACVLRLASGTARARMVDAAQLVTRYPTTLTALEDGQITYWHALRLVEAGRGHAPEVMAEVEQKVLAKAAEQSVGQFGSAVRRTLARLDPQSGEQRRRIGLAERRVVFMPHDDGTTDLWAGNLPAAEAAAMEARVREIARSWKGQDERTADQRQADALVALTLGAGDPDKAQVKPTINVVVAMSTLLGADEQPADLDGSAIPAALARAIATDPSGTWRRLVTDENRRLVDVTADSYEPPVNMARLVRFQQPRCVFPHCRRRAVNCELDHIRARADGGPTTPRNLQPLCPRHHHLKHESGWQVRSAPDGSTLWTSTTGRTYRRPPDDELPIDTTSRPPSEADAA